MAAHGLARDQAGSQWGDAVLARTNPRGWPDAFTEDLEDERTEVLDLGVSAYGTNQQLRAELARRGW